MLSRVYKILALTLFLSISIVTSVVYSQDQQCEGDHEMCAQVLELKRQIEAQKQITIRVKSEEKEHDDKTARMIGFAAALAVILKILVSLAKSWKGYFKTDKQKAWLKVGLVVSGFIIFVATNVGLGIDWWQSIILAGGGPGSILVHELTKLAPVLKGKKKYDEVDPDGDPTSSDAPGV